MLEYCELFKKCFCIFFNLISSEEWSTVVFKSYWTQTACLVFFPERLLAIISLSLSGCCCQYSRLIKSLWHKWPATLICYPPRCIDSPSHKRLFEGCWSPIYICNTFVLIKCSHSMEIGYLTKWLEPTVIRLIAVYCCSHCASQIDI